MSFVLRREDGFDVDLGPTMAVLGMWSRLLKAIPDGRHDDYAELIEMVDRAEDEWPAGDAARLADQAATLKDLEGVDRGLVADIVTFGSGG